MVGGGDEEEPDELDVALIATPRIEPGDKIARERMLFDYKVRETKFAGPTMFSRGDTTYANQNGEFICKQRSTSIRYLAEEARKRGAPLVVIDITPQKHWGRLDGVPRRGGGVEKGAQLIGVFTFRI